MIDVLTYKQGISIASEATNTGTAGSRTGKTNFEDLVIVKSIDISSPILMQKCALGEGIPQVELQIITMTGKFFKKSL